MQRKCRQGRVAKEGEDLLAGEGLLGKQIQKEFSSFGRKKAGTGTLKTQELNGKTGKRGKE